MTQRRLKPRGLKQSVSEAAKEGLCTWGSTECHHQADGKLQAGCDSGLQNKKIKHSGNKICLGPN